MIAYKPIREIANIIKGTKCGGDCDKCGKCVEYNTAVDLYNAGYRKLPEDSVVLSREEYDNLKLELQKAHNKGVQAGFDMTKFKEQSIKNKASKETAEKFAEKLKIKAIKLTAIESYHICKFVDELLKEYEQ